MYIAYSKSYAKVKNNYWILQKRLSVWFIDAKY